MNQYWEGLQEGLGLLRTLPWLMLALLALPLIILAATKRVFPSTPLVLLLIVPCLLTLGLLIEPQLLLVIALLDIAIAILAAADLVTLPGVRSFSVQRQVARVASLGMHHPVSLTISNHTNRPLHISSRDDLAQEFEALPKEFVLRLGRRSRTTVHYDLKPQRRGAFLLASVHLRARSRLGMWRRYLSLPCESAVHVYPDMKQMSEYAVLARTNRLSLMGVRRTRRIGQDNEFERLRDYTPDDNYKHIDWRSTARRNKLTVKDFQTNQSQRILFLLDCGRMMTNQAAGLSLLDHALNAILMLSFVALRQGDSVGLISFSDEIHSFVPVRGGLSQMNHLLHASFDRFPRLVESRYDQVFLYLASRCRKRSLVILISNVIDEVNAYQIEQYLGTLVGHHLPLSVLLRDHQLFDAADHPDLSESALYRAAAAAEIISWRQQVLTDLQHKGILSLDVLPEEMTAPLVNQYLEIKARHLL